MQCKYIISYPNLTIYVPKFMACGIVKAIIRICSRRLIVLLFDVYNGNNSSSYSLKSYIISNSCVA